MELHFGLALANLLFSSPGFQQPPRCYVTALCMPRAAPFIPLLTDVAEKGASLSVAFMVMSIVTISSDYPFVSFGVNTIRSCMKRFPDDTKLRVDYAIGKKFCAWVSSIYLQRHYHLFFRFSRITTFISNLSIFISRTWLLATIRLWYIHVGIYWSSVCHRWLPMFSGYLQIADAVDLN
jgi:hypothetical protein